MTFAISILKIFFQKKFFAQNCLIRKDHRLFSRFAKIFQFFNVAPIINFLKCLKKLNFLMTMRSWTLIMVPLFLVSDSLSEKLTFFFKFDLI